MTRLQGRVAIVTGGARGMGAATVRKFHDEGAAVVVADLLAEEGAALAAELGDRAVYHSLDVTNEAQWIELVSSVQGRFGRIDALVNNAGVLGFGTIEEVSVETIDLTLAVNVKGALLGMKHVGGAMKLQRAGAIVNISSVDGLRGVNAVGVYSASKWAVRGATKAAALEFGPHGVRVNSVHPGGVDTAMGNPQGQKGAERNWSYGRVPLQRIGEPSEIANVSVFLCSDEASYVTGAEVAVDGGWAAGYYHAYLPGAPPSLAGG